MDEEIARGNRARQLLDDPLMVEAIQAMKDQLALLRRDVSVRDRDMHTRLILTEQLLDRFLAYFQGVMQSGDMARQELKLRESAVRDFGNAMRYGIRNMGVY